MVHYRDVIRFIQEKLPNAKIKVENKGIEPGMDIERCIIEVEIDKYNFSFNFGANIVFNFEDSPRALLKHQNLMNSRNIRTFVNNCINNLDKYSNENFSFAYTIENYARKYFGAEKSIRKKNKSIYIYYDKFYIVASPNIILLVLNKTNHTVRLIELKEGVDLEKIFREFNFYAEGIKKGRIT